MNSRFKISLFAAALAVGALSGTSAFAQAVTAANLKDAVLDKAGDALGLIRGNNRNFNAMIIHEMSYKGQAADLEAGSMELKPFERCTFGVSFYEAANRLDCDWGGDARTIRVVREDAGAWDEAPEPGFNPAYVDDAIKPLRLAQTYLYPAGFIRAVAFQQVGQNPVGGKENVGGVAVTAIDGGKTQIDTTIFGVPYKAILDAEARPESIEAAVPFPDGSTKTIVATFGAYRNGDGLGDPLDKFHTGSYFPTTFKQTVDGQTVAEGEVYEGWSNPYVIFPKPELLWANGYGTPNR
jgi:hypothetical protein